MRPRSLTRLLLAYAVLLVGLCLGLYLRLAVDPQGPAEDRRIITTWAQGERTGRSVVSAAEVPAGCGPGCTLAVDAVLDRAPILSAHPNVLKFSLVPGRDGLEVTLDGRTVYATPDDLIAWGAAAGHSRFGNANIMLGINNVHRALDNLARELGVPTEEMHARGRFRRVVLARAEGDGRVPYGDPVPLESIDAARVRRGVMGAAHYLARHVRRDGEYDYQVDIVTGENTHGNSLARRGISTWFLAEAAVESGDPELRAAALRGAGWFADRASARCGQHLCVGRGGWVSLGATATAVLGYATLVRAGLGERFRAPMKELAAFMRSMQRADGEFMHFYDRKNGRPINRQTQYVLGQIALALVMVYEINGDPADLEAARRGIRYATSKGWDFFGSRYFFANEHWTCQAVEALWPHAPDPGALDFCLRFNAFSRIIQTPEGGYNLNPIHVPRVTETGSRTEAAVATLRLAALAGVDAAEIARLEAQSRRCVAYLLGYQYDPGPVHLMKRPELLHGGMPGSKVDLSVRIDYAQHAGGGLIRYLRYLERPPGG